MKLELKKVFPMLNLYVLLILKVMYLRPFCVMQIKITGYVNVNNILFINQKLISKNINKYVYKYNKVYKWFL